ncbi:MAG: dihydrodipicolinate reductase [Verrucomicrobia bacterium]|nr:dihydrodipicolinate reductase [Verrucomicrobiota bacterium]MBU1734113.1 dihydrodipicolinate reductase [Verrucomicrobiota bacterium]MBU1856427.1 dihydrodipicolinate reductase [Verrucomicrobiota bacterium]
MINIIQIGLGPLGQKAVRYALERGTIQIVGAVDPAPDKAGQDLGKLCGIKKRTGVVVHRNLDAAMKGVQASVAVLTTVSSLKRLEPQVGELARAGLHIVSTCEELAFPWKTQPQIAKRLDVICKQHGVACVGTGVNPGYLMDFLPCILTAVCQRVDRIRVSRIQDASPRRIPFQQKIGAGLTQSQFQAKVRAGTLRHVGLTESMHMIAHHLGWKLTRVTESLHPVIAKREIRSGYKPIRRGEACGVEQIGRATCKGKEIIKLHFRAAVGEPASFDKVEIDGEPAFTTMIPGGVNGDIATCAITINAIRSIVKAAPGLRTMIDLPPAGFTATF